MTTLATLPTGAPAEGSPAGRARTPALALTIFFVAGEATRLISQPRIGFLISGSLLAVAMFLAYRSKFAPATLLVLVGFFSLGGTSYRLARFGVERQGLLELYESLGKKVFQHPCLVEGRLRREPELRSDSAVMFLQVQHLSIGNRKWPSSGGLRTSVHGAPRFRKELARLRGGDRVRFWAVLRRARGFLNPGGFDVAAYLERSGLSLSGSVESALLVERIEPAPWWRSLDSRVRDFVRHRIEVAYEHLVEEDDESPGILIALLIGDRSRIPVWAERLYQRAGTFHVIAISGAHVGIFAWFLHGGLRRMGLDQRPSLVVLLLVLPLYACLCGGRPSVVRAVLMSCGVVGSKLLSLDAPVMNGLAVSALLLLVARPLDLEDPGFQLSFVATASILGLSPTFSPWLARYLGRLSSPVAISLAAQMGVVPILAWHFQRLTPAAIGANLFAMPLAAGLIVTGAILVAVAPLPWVGTGLAWVAMFMAKGLTASSRLAVAIPGGSLRVTSPTWEWLCAYLFLLAVAVVFEGWWRKCSLLLLCFMTLGLAAGSVTPSSSSHLRLTALDVGHGDALLVELPGGERILVDGGGSSSRSFDMGESVVVPALLHRGIRRLDAVIVTHPDLDHIGGLAALVSNLRVEELWEGRSGWRLRHYRELRGRAWARRVKVRRLLTGEELFLGQVQIKVLSAGDLGGAQTPSTNEGSLVLKLIYGRSSILLTGDAGKATESALLRAGAADLIRADVLKVGHHGSNSSTSPQFLEAVAPRLAVISARSSGLFRLPSARVLRRLRARGIPILRTDRDGAVTVKLDRNGRILVETFDAR